MNYKLAKLFTIKLQACNVQTALQGFSKYATLPRMGITGLCVAPNSNEDSNKVLGERLSCPTVSQWP